MALGGEQQSWRLNKPLKFADVSPPRRVCFPLQTVLNTMCGYGKQRAEERLARQRIFTVGCLEKIVWWAKNNLLLVAGLTGGLLLLEVTRAVPVRKHVRDTSVNIITYI